MGKENCIEDLPGLNHLYSACDWSFNKTMDLAEKISLGFEDFLREHQGGVAFVLGFSASYSSVRFFEKVSKNYDKFLSYCEKAGYIINGGILATIEIMNYEGLQGLLEQHPVFTLGLFGLLGGSTIAAIQEGKNRRIKKLENIGSLPPEKLN